MLLKLIRIEKIGNRYRLYYDKEGIVCILEGDTKEKVLKDFFRLSHYLLINRMKKYISLN